MGKFKAVAVSAVVMGQNIPAHDETCDIAESIGQQLDAFRAYVASVRSEEQADEAVKELIIAFATSA